MSKVFLPSPNEVEFLLWASERNAAGDVDIDCNAFHYGIGDHTTQQLLHGLRVFGTDGALRFEDIDTQFRVRAGVERPPWGFRQEFERDIADEYELPICTLDDLQQDDDEYDDYDYDRWEEEEEEGWHALSLPEARPYQPELDPGGASEWRGAWYVVWGDWLWEARDGSLSEVVELPDPCELVCRIGSRLIVYGGRWHAYDLEAREFVVGDGGDSGHSPIPAFDLSTAYAPSVRHLGSKVWHETPLSTAAMIVDVSPDGNHYRLYDRLGKGGVFATLSGTRLSQAGGPRTQRPSREGPRIDGSPSTRESWRDIVRRNADWKEPHQSGARATAFVRLEDGRVRWTDNGLTFFEDERLVLVLDRLACQVDFSLDGRRVMVTTGDTMRLIELDERRVLGEWRRPARLRYLRCLLPAYQPDEYVEQIVALWQVLGCPKERSETCGTALPPASLPSQGRV